MNGCLPCQKGQGLTGAAPASTQGAGAAAVWAGLFVLVAGFLGWLAGRKER